LFRDHYSDRYASVFGEPALADIEHRIATHDDAGIDWQKDAMTSAVRVADNLSLYAQDKLPQLFRLVPNSIPKLEAIQTAQIAGDKARVAEIKGELEQAIREAPLTPPMREALLNASQEVSGLTPKFTLGMLGGSVHDIGFEDGGLRVTIEESEYDTRLSTMFDMGQRQFGKFAEAYGTDKVQGHTFDFGGPPPVLRGRITKDPSEPWKPPARAKKGPDEAAKSWRIPEPIGGNQAAAMVGRMNMAKAMVNRDALALGEIPDGAVLIAIEVDEDLRLVKGASHKYIKRTPYTNARGKQSYRYWYSVPGTKHGIVHSEHLKVGSSFKAHGGHYHISKVDADKGMITVKHDESGNIINMTEANLRTLMHYEQRDSLTARHRRLRGEVDASQKHGSTKQKAGRLKDLADHERVYGAPEKTAGEVTLAGAEQSIKGLERRGGIPAADAKALVQALKDGEWADAAKLAGAVEREYDRKTVLGIVDKLHDAYLHESVAAARKGTAADRMKAAPQTEPPARTTGVKGGEAGKGPKIRMGGFGGGWIKDTLADKYLEDDSPEGDTAREIAAAAGKGVLTLPSDPKDMQRWADFLTQESNGEDENSTEHKRRGETEEAGYSSKTSLGLTRLWQRVNAEIDKAREPAPTGKGAEGETPKPEAPKAQSVARSVSEAAEAAGVGHLVKFDGFVAAPLARAALKDFGSGVANSAGKWGIVSGKPRTARGEVWDGDTPSYTSGGALIGSIRPPRSAAEARKVVRAALQGAVERITAESSYYNPDMSNEAERDKRNEALREKRKQLTSGVNNAVRSMSEALEAEIRTPDAAPKPTAADKMTAADGPAKPTGMASTLLAILSNRRSEDGPGASSGVSSAGEKKAAKALVAAGLAERTGADRKAGTQDYRLTPKGVEMATAWGYEPDKKAADDSYTVDDTLQYAPEMKPPESYKTEGDIRDAMKRHKAISDSLVMLPLDWSDADKAKADKARRAHAEHTVALAGRIAALKTPKPTAAEKMGAAADTALGADAGASRAAKLKEWKAVDAEFLSARPDTDAQQKVRNAGDAAGTATLRQAAKDWERSAAAMDRWAALAGQLSDGDAQLTSGESTGFPRPVSKKAIANVKKMADADRALAGNWGKKAAGQEKATAATAVVAEKMKAESKAAAKLRGAASGAKEQAKRVSRTGDIFGATKPRRDGGPVTAIDRATGQVVTGREGVNMLNQRLAQWRAHERFLRDTDRGALADEALGKITDIQGQIRRLHEAGAHRTPGGGSKQSEAFTTAHHTLASEMAHALKIKAAAEANEGYHGFYGADADEKEKAYTDALNEHVESLESEIRTAGPEAESHDTIVTPSEHDMIVEEGKSANAAKDPLDDLSWRDSSLHTGGNTPHEDRANLAIELHDSAVLDSDFMAPGKYRKDGIEDALAESENAHDTHMERGGRYADKLREHATGLAKYAEKFRIGPNAQAAREAASAISEAGVDARDGYLSQSVAMHGHEDDAVAAGAKPEHSPAQVTTVAVEKAVKANKLTDAQAKAVYWAAGIEPPENPDPNVAAKDDRTAAQKMKAAAGGGEPEYVTASVGEGGKATVRKHRTKAAAERYIEKLSEADSRNTSMGPILEGETLAEAKARVKGHLEPEDPEAKRAASDEYAAGKQAAKAGRFGADHPSTQGDRTVVAMTAAMEGASETDRAALRALQGRVNAAASNLRTYESTGDERFLTDSARALRDKGAAKFMQDERPKTLTKEAVTALLGTPPATKPTPTPAPAPDGAGGGPATRKGTAADRMKAAAVAAPKQAPKVDPLAAEFAAFGGKMPTFDDDDEEAEPAARTVVKDATADVTTDKGAAAHGRAVARVEKMAAMVAKPGKGKKGKTYAPAVAEKLRAIAAKLSAGGPGMPAADRDAAIAEAEGVVQAANVEGAAAKMKAAGEKAAAKTGAEPVPEGWGEKATHQITKADNGVGWDQEYEGHRKGNYIVEKIEDDGRWSVVHAGSGLTLGSPAFTLSDATKRAEYMEQHAPNASAAKTLDATQNHGEESKVAADGAEQIGKHAPPADPARKTWSKKAWASVSDGTDRKNVRGMQRKGFVVSEDRRVYGPNGDMAPVRFRNATAAKKMATVLADKHPDLHDEIGDRDHWIAKIKADKGFAQLVDDSQPEIPRWKNEASFVDWYHDPEYRESNTAKSEYYRDSEPTL